MSLEDNEPRVSEMSINPDRFRPYGWDETGSVTYPEQATAEEAWETVKTASVVERYTHWTVMRVEYPVRMSPLLPYYEVPQP